MIDGVMEVIEDREKEFDHTVEERIGKILVVGFVTFVASLAAEALCDRAIERRHERKENAEA